MAALGPSELARRRKLQTEWHPWTIGDVLLLEDLGLQEGDVVLLEFAQGDRFEIVKVIKDVDENWGGWEYRLDSLQTKHGGYISDVPTRYLLIPDPKGH